MFVPNLPTMLYRSVTFSKGNDAAVDCVNGELLLSRKPSYDVAFDGFAASNPNCYVSNDTVTLANT